MDEDDDIPRLAEMLMHRAGIHRDSGLHLAETYGVRATQLIERENVEPTHRLLERIVKDLPHLWIEVVWAAEQEMALTLEDLLIRRTGIHYRALDQGVAIAEEAAMWMGKTLGWSDGERAEQVRRYLDAVAAGNAWRTDAQAAPRSAAREEAA